MAMGTRKDQEQEEEMWVPQAARAKGASHPFYQRLNQRLEETHFDAFVEGRCRRFYAQRRGRPSLAPGVYFRLLLIGYFEGIDSERGIAWRANDWLALRRFLRVGLDATPPDHSTISRTRRLMDVETHREVFTGVRGVEAEKGRRKGQTLGVDATTLEANAALRTIMRRDTEEGYQEFLKRRAPESGIKTPTREQLARLDRKPSAQGIEGGVGAPARSGCPHRQDEGWADAPGAQGRARSGFQPWRGGSGHGAARRRGRHGDGAGDGV